MYKEIIKSEIAQSIKVKSLILENKKLIEKIETACNIVTNAYKSNNKTIFAGNGGSAADCQHLAAEFVGRYYFDRPALKSIALTTDTSILTAVGNDYGFLNLFSRQIEAIAEKGDVFFAISTSGNSPNIINALKKAKEKNVYTIGLTGKKDCKMNPICDLVINVPSEKTARVQEAHILIGHIICGVVEKEIFKQ